MKGGDEPQGVTEKLWREKNINSLIFILTQSRLSHAEHPTYSQEHLIF